MSFCREALAAYLIGDSFATNDMLVVYQSGATATLTVFWLLQLIALELDSISTSSI